MADSEQKCSTVGCEKPASKLQCPTCLKFGRNSFFCGQECFKANWNIHKLFHVEAKKKAVVDSRFAGFRYTGKLRAAAVSEMRKMPPHIKRPDYADDPQGTPHSEMAARGTKIVVLTPEDQEKARKAGRFGREVLDIAGRMIKAGVTTEEIDIAVHEACIERNCYPSPLNYRLFPKSCCTSVNEIVCHGIPDARALEDGDICNVDITVFYDGFHGDLNETFFVGKVSDEHRHLVKVTYECLEKAIAKVKPGELYRNLGNVITRHANDNKLSVVRSYCGHGIHREFHTAPNVPHYSKNKAVGVMKAGHCFTIEPMINMGGWQDILWPDDWTSATRDGKWSAQFEQTLLVTETGCEILTGRIEGVEYSKFSPFYIPGK